VSKLPRQNVGGPGFPLFWERPDLKKGFTLLRISKGNVDVWWNLFDMRLLYDHCTYAHPRNQAKSGVCVCVCEREREREREIDMAQSSHCDVRTIDNILLCQLFSWKCVHVWTHCYCTSALEWKSSIFTSLRYIPHCFGFLLGWWYIPSGSKNYPYKCTQLN